MVHLAEVVATPVRTANALHRQGVAVVAVAAQDQEEGEITLEVALGLRIIAI